MIHFILMDIFGVMSPIYDQLSHSFHDTQAELFFWVHEVHCLPCFLCE